ncbi:MULTISPECIES: hypothetical protein [unclassified Serratia (in: enterobacteria)]|uniref:hypothetical protein n=1 Tax=unclassified Serratia (in: enterobacteria) TaxID=2647522 RepID=UPI000A9CC9EF|nr:MULTISPECIES: hypothetical protein [unclassified Serratia (in: enterobacteria)]
MKLGAGFWLTSQGFNAYWTLAILWRERELPLLLTADPHTHVRLGYLSARHQLVHVA